MAAYRIYKANFPFAARVESELTIEEGDDVMVYQKPGGEWPDQAKWMNGTNKRTGEKGEFPGTYCEFVEEVAPAPPIPIERLPSPPVPDAESAPPVPPRKTGASVGELGRGEREAEREMYGLIAQS